MANARDIEEIEALFKQAKVEIEKIEGMKKWLVRLCSEIEGIEGEVAFHFLGRNKKFTHFSFKFYN